MSDDELAKKRAELSSLEEEISADQAHRLLRDPVTRMFREERRLCLERELAAAAGDEYADPLELDVQIGIEWYAVVIPGQRSMLLCGDPGEPTSTCFRFDGSEESRISGETDGPDINPLRGKGLGIYGLFVVRNSRWKVRLVAAAAESIYPREERRCSQLEHYIVRGKGGELACLAESVKTLVVPEPIVALRERLRFRDFFGSNV